MNSASIETSIITTTHGIEISTDFALQKSLLISHRVSRSLTLE